MRKSTLVKPRARYPSPLPVCPSFVTGVSPCGFLLDYCGCSRAPRRFRNLPVLLAVYVPLYAQAAVHIAGPPLLQRLLKVLDDPTLPIDMQGLALVDAAVRSGGTLVKGRSRCCVRNKSGLIGVVFNLC